MGFVLNMMIFVLTLMSFVLKMIQGGILRVDISNPEEMKIIGKSKQLRCSTDGRKSGHGERERERFIIDFVVILMVF